jgi:hypothetical protein
MAQFFDAPPAVAIDRRKYLPRRQGDDIRFMRPATATSSVYGD